MTGVSLREAAAFPVVPEVDQVALNRSGRILSGFGDTRLIVDVSYSSNGAKLWERNLSSVTLSMWGAGASAKATVSLLSVKFAAHWAYLAIAAELDRATVKTRLGERISGGVQYISSLRHLDRA